MCIRDRYYSDENGKIIDAIRQKIELWKIENLINENEYFICLLYTSDAADERSSVDLGGRRIIKKKK